MCPLHLISKSDLLILEAYHDFILSRKAYLLSPRTIEYYEYTVGEFVDWLISRGITEPDQITPFDVRAYITSVSERGVASATAHSHARGTRAFLRFLNEEGYIPSTYKCEDASC